MKKLVTPEVFNQAVEAARQMALCKGNFDVYLMPMSGSFKTIKEFNDIEILRYKKSFESYQWYTALFPVNEITLHDPNLPAEQTVDLQRILQAVESTKLYLNVLLDETNIDNQECEDNINSLQAVADYIISLRK